MTMRFPDFFLIGAPKCGTTSLFSWLQNHPDTFLPVKEANFFSSDILNVSGHAGAIRTEAEYLARMCPPEAEGKLTGEATPKYLYSDTALARLVQEADRVRLIVLLRNPVDLVVAMHAQNVRQGYEHEHDFLRAWERGLTKSVDKLIDYRFWGQPAARLEAFLAAFPRHRLLVLILEEEMRHDPAAAHARALEFLGLAPQRLKHYAVHNPRKTSRSPQLQGLSRRVRRSAYMLFDRAGFRPSGTGLLTAFDWLNGNRTGQNDLPADLRAEIAAELDQDARRVAACLGRTALPWSDFDWPATSEADWERGAV